MDVPLLATASAIAIVAYGGVVIWHGHLIALLNQFKGEIGFLYWLAAGGLLYILAKQQTIGVPVRMIVSVAILAALLKIFSNGTLNSIFQGFAAGNLSISDAFVAAGVQAGKGFGIYNGQSNGAVYQPGTPLSQTLGAKP